MKSLTIKQKKVLEFISEYISKNKQSPTIEEIRAGLEFKSTRSVSQYLEALVEKRYITKTGDARSINLIDCDYEEIGSATTLLPLYGLASCGTPEFYAEDNVEEYIENLTERTKKKLLKIDSNLDLRNFKIEIPKTNSSHKVKKIMIHNVSNRANQHHLNIYCNSKVAETLSNVGIGQSTGCGFGTIYLLKDSKFCVK